MSGFPTATATSVALTDFQNLVNNLKYNPFFNLLANGSFERTTHGDLRCDYWQEDGVANERSATQKKFGDYALKISPAAISDHAFQDVAKWEDLKGVKVSVGCWVYAPAASVILRISDGVGTSDSAANTGTGAWEWLEVTRTISASATRVRMELRPTNTAGDFYFDGAILVCGDEAPRSSASPVDIAQLIRHFEVLDHSPDWLPELGDEYFNSTDGQKYTWNGTSWVIL